MPSCGEVLKSKFHLPMKWCPSKVIFRIFILNIFHYQFANRKISNFSSQMKGRYAINFCFIFDIAFFKNMLAYV